MPLIEGQLKEKHGRLRWFRPWQTKYFTLSSAALTSSLVVKRRGISTSSADLDAVVDKIIAPSIELQKIRLVKSLSRNSRKNPKLLKYFESALILILFIINSFNHFLIKHSVLTDENRLLLKASDRAKADEWFKCLQIAVAQSQREKPFQIL
jgi:hypothetical protein